ncbi:hypothetical protein I203_102608 [Kwoniella mangroviensis CBS 8507]|uniref:uncharacterized protein n=1 Tax=Kwoniella mangroviensis CBS 8507 TaxID=1296122 RepID=UPI00080D6200|nr:uncharacterized protein I203_03591 [Kwoniella mangroviensis CBS 8507]OCF66909.1 hypothetical protein I203_03591 [Kwoniella mangroviensis CBS 8507]
MSSTTQPPSQTKSRLPPVQTKGLKFGAGSSSQGSSSGKGSNNKGKSKEDEDGKLPFLDYISCNICNEAFFDGIAKGKIFWMTSCAHVLCNDEQHQHKEGICTVCGKTMQAVTMEHGNLQPIQENFLSNPEFQLEKALSEYEDQSKKFVKNVLSIKGIYKFQTNQHKKTRSLNKERLDKALAEIERLKDELHIHVAENVELKLEIKQLQDRLNMPPPPIDTYQSRGAGSMPPPIYGRTLTAVEEVEEEPNGLVGETSSSKRRRIDNAEQPSRSLVPSTPRSQPHYAQLLDNSYQTPQHDSYERPISAAGYSAVPLTTNPARPDLERYRYNSTPLNGTSPQAYSQGHTNGGSTPLHRPASAFEGVPGIGGYMGGFVDGDGSQPIPAPAMMNNGFRQSSPPYEGSYSPRRPPPNVYSQPPPESNRYSRDAYNRSLSPNAHDGGNEGKFTISQPPKRPLPPPF